MGRNKPAVHDSPVFPSHTNTHLLEISSPRTGIWSDEFFSYLFPAALSFDVHFH